jgi:hypothetical protein
MNNKIIKFENENCTFTFDFFTKAINGYGKFGNIYYGTKNETKRGFNKASKEINKVFNKESNILDIVRFLTDLKIRMSFNNL